MDVDPFPGAPGIWIQGVTPSQCFRHLGAPGLDGDYDWLIDDCELALAQAFRPLWRFSLSENCSEREPVWAAKYFPAVNSIPSVVRIAYMLSYWTDCGYLGFGAHDGDSESVMVEVMFNASSQHWQFRQMWTSAHFGKGTHDRSRWNSPSQTEFPEKALGYPRIWIGGDKHGNFSTRSLCNNGAIDDCHEFEAFSTRDTVLAERNAGSRHRDLLGCIYSTLGLRHLSGRCEVFYGSQRFNGWASGAPGTGGSSPYRKTLMNAQFERRDESGNPDWGPGPYPPGYAPYSTYISGPYMVQPGALCQWFLHSGLSGSVEWMVDGEVIGTDWNLWYSFTEDKILSVFIRNGSDGEDDARIITVSSSAPPCSSEV